MPACSRVRSSSCPAGPTNGPAGEILLVARLLAHEHHLGAGGSLAEHGLGGVLVEVAPAAALHRLAELRERAPFG
jgi:hypothetical protein